MNWTLELTGINLEKCLSLASKSGIVVKNAARFDGHVFRIHVPHHHVKAFRALCTQYGWSIRVIRMSTLQRVMEKIKNRPSLPAALALFIMLTWCSSKMLWQVEVLNAGKTAGEVRAYLAQEGIRPGRLKAAISASELKNGLTLRLPDLSFVGVSWAGSTLIIDCRNALEGETAHTVGEALDLIALQDGVVTHMAVQSGTPLVEPGQVVRTGDVLIKGEERGAAGSVHPVQALGEVQARVWARGDARVSRMAQRTVETGEYRRRVTLCTPWGRRVVREAEPFDAQDVSTDVEPLVGLYLPVWREIETFARIQLIREPRNPGDAASMAQGAAEQAAKLKCPTGVEILDKWVDYSMIDNEFVCSTVVLEYEHAIQGRADAE